MIRHASRPITLGLAAAFTIVLAADSAAQSRDKKEKRQRRAVTQSVKRIRAERQSVRKTTLRAKEVRSSSPRIRIRTRDYREVRTDLQRPVIRRPETRRPEIRRPEIRRPEIRRPIVLRPETRRPEIRRPEVRRPEVRRPETRRPDFWRPEERRPDVRRPEIRRPEVRRPEPPDREARPGRQVREVRPNDRLRVRPEWKATSGGSSRIHVRSRDGRRGYGYGRHGVRRHGYDHYCHIHRRYVPFSHFGHHHRPFRFGHHSAFGGFGFHTGHWHFVIAINLPIGHRHHHHYVSHRWWDGHRSSLYTWDRARAVRTVSTAGPAYYDFTGETCVSLRLTTRDGELHELQIDPRYYEAKDPGDLYAALWGQLERDGRLELQDLDGVIYVFPAGLLQEIEAAPCY